LSAVTLAKAEALAKETGRASGLVKSQHDPVRIRPDDPFQNSIEFGISACFARLTMRALLVPVRQPAYGQDFLANAIAHECGLEKIQANDLTRASQVSSILVCQNPDAPDELAFLEAVPAGTAVILHIHCQHSYYEDAQLQNIGRALRRASYAISPATFHASEWADFFPSVKWRVVYNGIDPERYEPSNDDERTTWRTANGISIDRPLLAFVGRLEPPKGLEILKLFCRSIDQTNANILIQFLSNSDKNSLVEYKEIAEQLKGFHPSRIFLFPDKDPSKPRPIRFCDALFTPSLSEVAPLVVLEALAAGIPVMGTHSTPFYEEAVSLRVDLRLGDYILKFPPEVDLRRKRSNLTIDDQTAETFVTNFLQITNRLSKPNYAERLKRSTSTQRAGFTQSDMIAGLKRVYDEAMPNIS
jgi:glycosyltransferase involved in cell wall biosynthesis